MKFKIYVAFSKYAHKVSIVMLQTWKFFNFFIVFYTQISTSIEDSIVLHLSVLNDYKSLYFIQSKLLYVQLIKPKSRKFLV
ncbi:hypothetical protein NSTC745_02392 [Nostoc sp. DSM 114161]|jgi:hypothetical protein